MFLRRYILLLFTLLSLGLQAQQYPVDVQVFVTPPYPQSLRGYADTFEQKIQAHFLLKDLSTGGRPFVLRFSLEDFQGQAIAQTPDYITPYLVNLSPGVRRTLTNIDFKVCCATKTSMVSMRGLTTDFCLRVLILFACRFTM